MRSAPGFFEDMSRHGIGAAWSKRFSSCTVGGRTFEARDVPRWSREDIERLMGLAVHEQQYLPMCWAFEALLIQSHGQLAAAWPAVISVLGSFPEEPAMAALEHILRYVNDPDTLTTMKHGPWVSYLLGKIFATRAQRKKSKADLQGNKKRALHFLSEARENVNALHEPSSPDPYRSMAAAAALGVAAAAAYESVAYLQWKGTRTTALSE